MKNTIELISIGTELLSGRTLNSHARALGEALVKVGLNLSRDTTIPDDIATIQSAVREAFARTDIVVVSGGLGPTSDDITRDALAGLFGCRIVTSLAALAELHKRFKDRGRTVTPAAERQALILEGAETLLNSVGMAPGELFFPDIGSERSERGSAADAAGQRPEGVAKALFIIPGPPNEFAAVLEDHIVPWLLLQFPDAVPLELRVLTTEGIGESDIVTRLEKESFQCPEIDIGFYPGHGRVEIRLNAPPGKMAALDAAENALRAILRDKLVAE